MSFVLDEAPMTPTCEPQDNQDLVQSIIQAQQIGIHNKHPATPEDNVSFNFDISDLAGNVVTGLNSTLTTAR